VRGRRPAENRTRPAVGRPGSRLHSDDWHISGFMCAAIGPLTPVVTVISEAAGAFLQGDGAKTPISPECCPGRFRRNAGSLFEPEGRVTRPRAPGSAPGRRLRRTTAGKPPPPRARERFLSSKSPLIPLCQRGKEDEPERWRETGKAIDLFHKTIFNVKT